MRIHFWQRNMSQPQWSGAVKLADLNDYIGPSQACIKPLQPPTGSKAKVSTGSMIEVQLESPDSFGALASSNASAAPAAAKSEFKQIRTDAQKRTAKISLQDCLACSGCITSAETVLVMQQSLDEFYASLAAEPRKIHVVTVSPQSRAALAARFGLSALQVAKKLTTLFKSLGVAHVFDSSFGLDISLIEAREEFLHRFRHHASGAPPPGVGAVAAAATSDAAASCASSAHASQTAANVAGAPVLVPAVPASGLPLLASECPGWICYAEKSQGDVLPFISAVKSPQQIMGTLVKNHIAELHAVTPDCIYHVTIMPCYDKKLEASREDFFDAHHQTKDVDCVLATSEIAELLGEKGIDLSALAEAPLDSMFATVDAEQQVLYAASTEAAGGNGGSGGYLECIFRHAAKVLFAVDLGGAPLTYKVGRNADTREVSLEIGGRAVLTFATAYGFRNIQNITRQCKSRSLRYDYVEIMACPSGCVNGGGQLKAPDAKNAKEVVRAVDAALHAPAVHAFRDPADNPAVRALYAVFVKDGPMSVAARRLFHTGYRAVPKSADLNPLAIRW